MNRILFLASLVLFFASCSQDDGPTPNANMQSKVVGDFIYTVIQGNAQEGAKGQYLKEEIKVKITNLTGNAVLRNLQFSISDDTGEIKYNNYRSNDTTAVQWRLGCNQEKQYLTITDINVCGIAKNKCIDVDIFKLSATADAEISSGWYYPCQSVSVYSDRFLYNDKRLAYFDNNKMFSTNDLFNTNWTESTPPYSVQYGHLDMLSSGEVFYSSYGDYQLSSVDGRKWTTLDLPFYSSSVGMEITDNGTYYLVGEYENNIYSSTTGSTWNTSINIYDETNYEASRPQALGVNGNKIYLVTQNNFVLEIDDLTKNVTVHEFARDAWSRYGDLGEYEVAILGSNIFLHQKNYYSRDVYVLNLNDHSVQTISVTNNPNMVKSDGNIYVYNNSSSNVLEWDGSGFVNKEYPEIEDPYNYYANYIGIYKGSLLGVSSENKLFYYVK